MTKSSLALHISSQTGTMRDYLTEMTGLMNSNLSDFADRVDQEADNLDAEGKDDWYDQNYDQEWKLTEVFPELYTKSFFVMIYSYIESTMKYFATALESHRQCEIKIDDLKGRGINLYKTYFEKVQSLPMKNSKSSQKIDDYRKIRNFIVHNNSRLDNTANAKHIKRFAKMNPTLLSIAPQDEIKINDQTNHDFLNAVELYLSELADLLSKT